MLHVTNGPLPTSSALSVKEAFYAVVATLVAAGWIRVGEGNNVTFANEGQTSGPYDTLITSGATWANNGWIRWREPVGTREFCMRFTSDGVCELWYSRAAGFVTGGAANARPTATDEVVILGPGWNMQGGATLRPYVVADDQPHNGAYHFWFAGIWSGEVSARLALVLDPTDEDNDTTGDGDPCVIYAYNTAGFSYNSMRSLGVTSGTPLHGRKWRRYGETDQLWVGVRAWAEGINNGTNAFPGGVPVNPFSGNDDICRINWARPASDGAQLISPSRFMCWKGVSTRSWPDTLDLASADARVYLEDCVLRWPTGIVPGA